MNRSELLNAMQAAQFAGKKEVIIQESAATGYKVVAVDDSWDFLMQNDGVRYIMNLEKDWDDQLDARPHLG